MKDQLKTKEALIQELVSLRKRILELERSESERKQVEEELHESEEKYRNILENIEDGYFEVDRAGDFTFFNPSICRILGYPREEMLGMNYRAYMDAENAKKVFQAFNKVYVTGIPTKGFEWEVIRKDGTRTYIEVSISLIVRPGEKPTRFRGIARDITERKQTEEALRESESLSKSLIDYMHDAMIILDWDGSILFANQAAARIIEFERPEEFIGHNMIEYLHPDSFQKAAEDIEAVKADKMGFLSEYRLCSVTGRHIWVESIGGKIIFRNASANLVCIRDITERKRVEDALKESENKYRLIADNMRDAITIMDMNLCFTFVSPSIMPLRGFTVEEVMEQHLEQVMTPESLQISAKVFEEEMQREASGKADPNRVRIIELEEYRKDMSTVWVEVSLSYLRNADGRPMGILSLTRDITERKKAEEDLKKTLESLRKAFGATIQVMVSAVESRDPYTAGHQIRSADLARCIATEMGLPHEKIEGLRMAGSIHDIGKMSIPAEILSKPTKLTNIEFSLIKEHPKQGYEMLKDVESPWPLAQIVYQHHERMDGSGYPRNLKGDDILIEARILAVADVVEAMASHRPYRPGLGIDAALNEIEKNSGIFYDITVADACLRLFREKGFQLEGT